MKLVALVLALAAVPAAAQDEAALKTFFEGRRVVVKMDMPGTSDGVDVRVDSARPVDYQRYGDRLRSDGIAIRAGDAVPVTLVKVKKDLIEFQLAGGGFGTFGDDTSTSVYMPHKDKTSREKELERLIREETDSRRRRRLEDELDELRDRRERENRRIDAEKARAEDRKRERIAEQRLRGGSRFNLRYADVVPPGTRPADVMAVLAEYVDFDYPASPPLADVRDARSDVRPVSDMPRKGMARSEAERLYGLPIDVSERREGSVTVQILVFVTGDQRITAEFVEDVLVRYTITPR